MDRKSGQKPLADVFESMESLQELENRSMEEFTENAKANNLDDEQHFRDSNPFKAIFASKKNLIGLGLLCAGLAFVGIGYSMNLFSPRSPQNGEIVAQNPEQEVDEPKIPEPEIPIEPVEIPLAPDPSLYEDDLFDLPEVEPMSMSMDLGASDYASESQSLSTAVYEEPETASEAELAFDPTPETPENELEEPDTADFLADLAGLESTLPEEEIEENDDLGEVNFEVDPYETREENPVLPLQSPRSRATVAMIAASELTPAPAVAPPIPQKPVGRRLSEHERRPQTERPISENNDELLEEERFPLARGQAPGNSVMDARTSRSATFGGPDASAHVLPGAHAGNFSAYQPIEHERPQPERAAPPREEHSVRQASSTPRKVYEPRFAKVRETPRGASLPNNHKQLWVEYDITPYTQAVGVVPGSLPEQNLVKWILRETGEQAWHGEPFGILSANSETLYVYHTPQMQEVVAEIVDRFMNPNSDSDQYLFRLVSLNNPTWFATNHALLKPVRIDTPGVHGWLLEKEDYARLVADVSRRSDYKELCSPQFAIRSGRSYPISSSVPKNYVKGVKATEDVWPGYVTEQGVIPEGFTMTLSPLSGVDGKSSHLSVKCEILQVEKMLSANVNMPSKATNRQRVPVDMPQIAHYQLDEQLWWPKDKVFLLDLGTIPMPASAQFNDAGKLIPEISRKLSGGTSTRGNVLLFIECRK